MVPTAQNSTVSDRAAALQLRAVVENAVDAILIIDRQGVVQTFNPAAERMFGYAAEEILNRNVSMLMPPPISEQHDEYIDNYLRTGIAKVVGIGRETLGLKRDGTIFPIELAVSETVDGDNHHFVGVVRDLSERRRLDEEILTADMHDRRRIGYDLHDGLCQELAGIAFTVRSIQEKIAAGEAVDPKELGGVTLLLQDAVRHVRGLAQGLHPVSPQPDGLVVALQQLAGDATELMKIRCRFESSPPVHLQNGTTATYLYRITQEAIRRAVVRAAADKIDIQLGWKKGAILLSVVDNGDDFSVDSRFGEGIVFRIMHHWARAIGAKLDMRPGPGGKGARLCCEVQIN